MLFCHLLTFVKISLFKNYFRNTISVSNGLGPGQDRQSSQKLLQFQIEALKALKVSYSANMSVWKLHVFIVYLIRTDNDHHGIKGLYLDS